MSARTTGISITPRRGLARAAFPQAIFISLCTNLRSRREGEAAGRADHGRIAARPGNGLVHHRDSFLPVSLCGYPFARRGGHPDHRGRRPGDEGAARNVSWLSARIRVPSVHSVSSGPTRSTGCRCSRSAFRRGDGSVLHELRFADRDRDLVLPELRRPRRTLTRRAMPLWRRHLPRPPVPPGILARGGASNRTVPRRAAHIFADVCLLPTG